MIRLALLDDHAAALAGLRRFLSADEGVEVLAAAPDAGSLARGLAGRRPDVLVLDYDPGRGDALSLCRRVKARPGAPRVLLYTAYAGPALAIAARAARADGVVDKSASAPQLSAAIRRLAAGTRVLPALSHVDYEAVVERLADDELATFALLLDDVGIAEIAYGLGVSERDAERRVQRVLDRIRPRGFTPVSARDRPRPRRWRPTRSDGRRPAP